MPVAPPITGIKTIGPLKAPFQWAGGKTRQIGIIREFFTSTFGGRYIEPFLGAGTVLLDRLQAWQGMGVTFIAADLNDALINFWVCVQKKPEELIRHLQGREFQNHGHPTRFKKAFVDLRDIFNKTQSQREIKQPDIANATRDLDTYFAALFLYLIRTSFNGIWRLAKDGRLTSGPGYPVRQIFDVANIKALHDILNQNSVQFLLMNFFQTIDFARKGDIAYCDPPYASSKDVSAGYIARQERYDDMMFQTQVRDACAVMSARGVTVLVSNADAPIIRNLFRTWRSHLIKVSKRMSNTSTQSNNELIIHNTVAQQLESKNHQIKKYNRRRLVG